MTQFADRPVDDRLVDGRPIDAGRLDAALEETRETLHDLSDLSERFARTFATSMSSAVRSGRSFGDTLRGLAGRLSDMALKAGLKPLENLFAKGVGTLVGAVAGQVTPFAKGGVVASPTYFSTAGRAGLMGEAGPEAIVPLARGADGRLGLAGGGSPTPVSVTVNVTTPDAASFRKSEAQVSAQLARAVSRARRTL